MRRWFGPETGGLEIARLELMGGDHWSVDKPFYVRLILQNQGTVPLRLWEPNGGEGNACVFILLTDSAQGKEVRLHAPPLERSASRPVAVPLPPGKMLTIDADLGSLPGSRSLGKGIWQLRVLYENHHESVGPVRGIWTGKLVSPPKTIHRSF